MVEKYIIDKSDIHKLLTGQDIELDKGSKARAFFVEIQGNPTYGDIIKAMFPDAEVVEVKYFDGIIIHYQVNFGKINGNQNIVNFKSDWWDAPLRQKVRKKNDAKESEYFKQLVIEGRRNDEFRI